MWQSLLVHAAEEQMVNNHAPVEHLHHRDLGKNKLHKLPLPTIMSSENSIGPHLVPQRQCQKVEGIYTVHVVRAHAFLLNLISSNMRMFCRVELTLCTKQGGSVRQRFANNYSHSRNGDQKKIPGNADDSHMALY